AWMGRSGASARYSSMLPWPSHSGRTTETPVNSCHSIEPEGLGCSRRSCRLQVPWRKSKSCVPSRGGVAVVMVATRARGATLDMPRRIGDKATLLNTPSMPGSVVVTNDHFCEFRYNHYDSGRE